MSSTPAEAGRAFRPRLWPTVATLAGLALLLSLGTWQLQRLEWKRGLIGHAQAQLAAAPLPLPETGLETLDFRRVSLKGTYLHDAAFAFGFTAEDGAPGSRLITPFRLDDGRVVLVDRGWLPTDLLPPHVPAGLQIPGTITLEGIGRWRGSWHRTWFTPDDSPAQRRWYGWDIPAMAEATGLPLEPLEVVLERSEGPAGLPQAEPVSVDLPNDHLGYAITWYSLALILVVIYVLFSTNRPGSARS
ncbi:MAG: SURF1 family protein [Geminicoccaceae bacterium]